MIIKDSTLRLQTKGFCHVLNITDEVQGRVDESEIESGTVTVFVVDPRPASQWLSTSPD